MLSCEEDRGDREILRRSLATNSIDDIEDDAMLITEATPLCSYTTNAQISNINNQREHYDVQKHRRWSLGVHIIFISFLILCSVLFALAITLQHRKRYTTYTDRSTTHDNTSVSERKDTMVEDVQPPELRSITYPIPPLYYMKSRSSSHKQAAHHMLGRCHDEDVPTLRWGILGPGKLSYVLLS